MLQLSYFILREWTLFVKLKSYFTYCVVILFNDCHLHYIALNSNLCPIRILIMTSLNRKYPVDDYGDNRCRRNWKDHRNTSETVTCGILTALWMSSQCDRLFLFGFAKYQYISILSHSLRLFLSFSQLVWFGLVWNLIVLFNSTQRVCAFSAKSVVQVCLSWINCSSSSMTRKSIRDSFLCVFCSSLFFLLDDLVRPGDHPIFFTINYVRWYQLICSYKKEKKRNVSYLSSDFYDWQ